MHRNVEALIGRLATDPELQRRFNEQPLEALLAERLELTDVELAALAATDAEALRTFSASLDTRLRKAPRTAETRPAGNETHTESERDSNKETER